MGLQSIGMTILFILSKYPTGMVGIRGKKLNDLLLVYGGQLKGYWVISQCLRCETTNV